MTLLDSTRQHLRSSKLTQPTLRGLVAAKVAAVIEAINMGRQKRMVTGGFVFDLEEFEDFPLQNLLFTM